MLIVAGASGALSSGVFGSIVYRDIPDIHLSTSGLDGELDTYLDLDSDGSNEFRFHLQWGHPATGYRASSVYVLGPLGGVASLSSGGFPSSTQGAESLTAGFVISASLPPPPPPPPFSERYWGTTGGQLSSDGEGVSDHGWWTGQAYLGVRFTQADGTHYGWIGMSATSHSIDVYDFAYESTPEGPIAAGAVPAPGTVIPGSVLASLALLRRRR